MDKKENSALKESEFVVDSSCAATDSMSEGGEERAEGRGKIYAAGRRRVVELGISIQPFPPSEVGCRVGQMTDQLIRVEFMGPGKFQAKFQYSGGSSNSRYYISATDIYIHRFPMVWQVSVS